MLLTKAKLLTAVLLVAVGMTGLSTTLLGHRPVAAGNAPAAAEEAKRPSTEKDGGKKAPTRVSVLR